MIKRQESRGFLHGITVAKDALKISHLLFVDDNFIFLKANPTGSVVLKEIMNEYSLASGQIINFDKSCICFSKNVRNI